MPLFLLSDACAVDSYLLLTCQSIIRPFSLLLLSHSLSLPLSHSLNSHYMETLLEQEEGQLDRVDSLPDADLASTSSGLSFVLTTEDSRSTTSSGDISTSSGEIPVIPVDEAAVPRLVGPIPSIEDLTATPTARLKCVGRNNKGVSWGLTSVIGRRREMEDAVAVKPGFMSRTCDHVGGCMAPGSRTSAEISPLHFFGVYDGHGGSQVHTSKISLIEHFIILVLLEKEFKIIGSTKIKINGYH